MTKMSPPFREAETGSSRRLIGSRADWSRCMLAADPPRGQNDIGDRESVASYRRKNKSEVFRARSRYNPQNGTKMSIRYTTTFISYTGITSERAHAHEATICTSFV